jgi:tRNA(Ile)-lysidine synthase
MGPEIVDRFAADLDQLIAPGGRLGIAVSGGADSLALLLLASAARPSEVEAATVDHALRPEAADEARHVAEICSRLGVPHTILTARWAQPPESAIQERARQQRDRLLGYWAEERGLGAIATGHHADDQAETLLMRLSRGAGVRGLAGMRARSVMPGSQVPLLRPLLAWRREELERLCAASGITPIADPSNEDERFERVRVRRALAGCGWLDGGAISRSAVNLAHADAAIEWAARNAWRDVVRERRGAIAFNAADLPAEILRRIVARAVRKLATEGDPDLRGRELDQLLTALGTGDEGTLRGVRCSGGKEWLFTAAPPRAIR